MIAGPKRPMRVRFAPSPTGSLHLGNARTALFNWIVARQSGGAFVLRVEDTDVDRQQEGSESGILEDLRWLGMEWDEGPDVGGPHGPYRQSERAEAYASAARRLLESGAAYRCFCDAETLERERARRVAANRPPHYSGRCRELEPEEVERRLRAGDPSVIRFSADRAGAGSTAVLADGRVAFRDRLRGRVEFPLKELGDTVIVRADGRPTYNFAVVVDDAAMAIDLVLRGDDHLSNTPRQVLMFEALGARPPQFAHLPMVRGEDGARLSKRHGAVSVAEYRRAGYPVAGLVNALALLGWSPGGDRTLVDRDDLLRDFDLDRVGRSAATFDRSKLDWICGQHLQRAPVEAVADDVAGRWVAAGRLTAGEAARAGGWLAELVTLFRDKGMVRYEQADELVAPFLSPGGEPSEDEARAALREGGAVDVVRALVAAVRDEPPVDAEAWKRVLERVKREGGAKGKALFHPVRAALTGSVSGPELDRLVPLVVSGHRILPERVVSVAERAERTLRWLDAN